MSCKVHFLPYTTSVPSNYRDRQFNVLRVILAVYFRNHIGQVIRKFWPNVYFINVNESIHI
jgi:hypothetical protein